MPLVSIKAFGYYVSKIFSLKFETLGIVAETFLAWLYCIARIQSEITVTMSFFVFEYDFGFPSFCNFK